MLEAELRDDKLKRELMDDWKKRVAEADQTTDAAYLQVAEVKN